MQRFHAKNSNCGVAGSHAVNGETGEKRLHPHKPRSARACGSIIVSGLADRTHVLLLAAAEDGRAPGQCSE
jgi:hypothetical protein